MSLRALRFSSIRSASRMNGAVVLFLDKVEKVNTIFENGVVLNGSLIKVFPLVTPARIVLLSNVPPFISDEVLKRELPRYGQLVSAIKKFPLGCKSPLLKHVVSFRRHGYWVLFLMRWRVKYSKRMKRYLKCRK